MSRTAGLLAVSACALGASAFLIPSGVALASITDQLTPTTLNTKSVALQLPCSECVFSPKKSDIKDEAEDDIFWIQGGANAVVLNFTISQDGERLALNGEDIYPMKFLDDSLAKTYADQVPATTRWEDIRSGNARTTPLELTGSGITIESSEEVAPAGDEMIAIKHTIFELEHQPVSIDSVSLKLLRTVAGELFIAHVETVERLPPRPNDAFGRPPPEEMSRFLPPVEELIDGLDHSQFSPRPHHGEGATPGSTGECGMLPNALCKLRNAVEAKVHGLKSGMRKGGCRGRPHVGQLSGQLRPHFMRPDHPEHSGPPRHHGRPHHHHHHHHEHGLMHSISRGFIAVLIPTLAGIAVGMAISLFGLVIGRLISFMWIKLYRGGRRGYASVALDDTTIEYKSEKEVGAEEDVESLPAYEQAPAYVEVMK